jgi:hypothetical protein
VDRKSEKSEVISFQVLDLLYPFDLSFAFDLLVDSFSDLSGISGL